MKVKVIKANLGSYWYADNIGKVYDVEEIELANHKFEYKVIGSELGGTKYFDKDDVEIINEGKEVKTFTKADLKTGMRVTLRDGTSRIALIGVHHKFYNSPADAENSNLLVNPIKGSQQWIQLSSYTEDLKCSVPGSEYWDVVTVGVPNHPYDVFYYTDGFTEIWQRDERTPEQKQLDITKGQITDLRLQVNDLAEQALKLQELINK